ncbi:MAG: 3-deoxy-manno-octulosonate cytidylyltransferase [Gammaproteobacteria bacterium]|nr:3-deoxy-manno-octulosonate cytidylyltransferase [Gammaproteobacteria bacterium]
MLPFDVVIPARYGSTRLPGKPLLDIAGKTLIQRVYDCARASHASQVVVATDDRRILEAVAKFGGEAQMTSLEHTSGTDRIAEVVHRLRLDANRIVVNLQGDEPLMPGALVDQVATTLAQNPDAMAATACYPIQHAVELNDPNVVKVVMDERGYALYFSRAPVPYPRFPEPDTVSGYRHIGVYAYRVSDILAFTRLPPSALELTEGLEQLRMLQTGNRIVVCVAENIPGEGVDTVEDLERARRQFARNVVGERNG